MMSFWLVRWSQPVEEVAHQAQRAVVDVDPMAHLAQVGHGPPRLRQRRAVAERAAAHLHDVDARAPAAIE